MRQIATVFATIATLFVTACGQADAASQGWDLDDSPPEVAQTVCEGDCCTTTTRDCIAVLCRPCDRGDWERVYFECD